MKRELALPVIAVSFIALACKDAAAPAARPAEKIISVQTGKAAIAVSTEMQAIETSATDASSRLTLSMTNSPEVRALRTSLSDLADFSATGDRAEALASAKASLALLGKVDPAERNPDAAAIRLVINGAINKLSQ